MSPPPYLHSCAGTFASGPKTPGLELTKKPRGRKPVNFQQVGESSRKKREEVRFLPQPPKPQLLDHLKELHLSDAIDNDGDASYFDSFPAGYRFCPTDQELIVDYLKKKVMKEELPRHKFKHIDIYRHNPEDLAAMFTGSREKEFYFFTPREKKYPNGTRPKRSAGGGYWKATGADRKIKFRGKEVGSKKSLVFYRGKPPQGDKTNWIMQEYRVKDPPPCKRHDGDMRLDEWVLCKIYKKVEKSHQEKAKEKPATSSHHEETVESDIEDHQNTPRFNAGAEDCQAWKPSRYNAEAYEYYQALQCYQALQPSSFVAGAAYCEALKPSGFDAAGAEVEELNQTLNSSYWSSMDMNIGEHYPLCTPGSDNYPTYEGDILQDIFLGDYENSEPLIE